LPPPKESFDLPLGDDGSKLELADVRDDMISLTIHGYVAM
jgi:hypothetical protein